MSWDLVCAETDEGKFPDNHSTKRAGGRDYGRRWVLANRCWRTTGAKRSLAWRKGVRLGVEGQHLVLELAGECLLFLVERDQGQHVVVLVGHVAQGALAEVLALVEGDGEPGVLVLELPFPGDGLHPEVAELVLLGS